MGQTSWSTKDRVSKHRRKVRKTSPDTRLKKKKYFFVPCGKFRSPYLGKAQQPQEQRHPFLPVCVVFSYVQTMTWLPVFGIFNVRTAVDACDCTRGPYGHRQRVCTGNRLWEKNSLPHRVLEPASVLRLACQSDALPTDLFPPLADQRGT